MGVIQSPDFFYVNGVSSETVGLYVDTPPVPPMAQQRVTTWATGIDMDASSPDDVWENISVTVEAFVFFPDSFDLGALYAFLAEAKVLQLSRFANRYLKVVQVGAITPSTSHDGKRIEISIDFLCSPFKYHTTNPETDVTSTSQIENPGTRYSRPIYKVEHALNAPTVLSVNGQTCTIKYDASNPVYIDTQRMICYDDNGNNMLTKTSGQFPLLSPGINLLSATSNGTTYHTLTVIGNWRDY